MAERKWGRKEGRKVVEEGKEIKKKKGKFNFIFSLTPYLVR